MFLKGKFRAGNPTLPGNKIMSHKKTLAVARVLGIVRERRVELLQVLPHRLLRPARLPISPLALIYCQVKN